MPLQLPNFDDRNYTDLVEEAISLIPTDASDWTNYNPSDPGITLIELFAYLTEMLLYRLNRVTGENIHSFLKLLNGPDWKPSGTSPEAIAKDVQTTILELRRQERAVSCQDFESLALAADPRIVRARCVPRRNLRMDFETDRPGHMGLVIVPQKGMESQLPNIISAVEKDLESRLLLTTRLHVVEPQYLRIQLQTTVVPLPDVQEDEIQTKAKNALEKFLDPLIGGDDEKGWPFGRNVFVSEIYQLLDQLPDVDYVCPENSKYSVELKRTDVNLPSRRIETKDGRLIGLEVKPYELIKVEVTVATARTCPPK